MAKKANARRYAQAVLAIALEKKELERWQTDLDNIVGTFSDAAFFAALDSPKIRVVNKVKFLKQRLPALQPLALNLVQLLIARNSVGVIRQIADEYRKLVHAYHGIVAADVITALPMEEADKRKMAQKLGALVGRQVEITAATDPAILGGFIARVGGKLLDGSTRTKLVALKKSLATGGETTK
jgi:F-type H+-transporting ATPase subunit delta